MLGDAAKYCVAVLTFSGCRGWTVQRLHLPNMTKIEFVNVPDIAIRKSDLVGIQSLKSLTFVCSTLLFLEKNIFDRFPAIELVGVKH